MWHKQLQEISDAVLQKLSPSEARELETEIELCPQNISTRTRLLGFYFQSGKLSGFSVDRIILLLLKLDYEVAFSVRPASRGRVIEPMFCGDCQIVDLSGKQRVVARVVAMCHSAIEFANSGSCTHR